MNLFASRLLRLALPLLGALALGGCISTQPLISHAHIGHAMTTWHDTPGQQGLLAVAEARLTDARELAEAGCRSTQPGLAGAHLRDSLAALAPELADPDQAGDYGAIRAFAGAIEHIEFAAGSEDASLNMVSSVAELSAQAALANRFLADTAVTLREQLATGRVRCRELLAALQAAADGRGAGVAVVDAPTIGVAQFRTLLLAMLARETNPPYEPVSRRYVLGLVRLPNGGWDFRLGPPPRRTAMGTYAGGLGGVGY